jgi:hypothetical protein
MGTVTDIKEDARYKNRMHIYVDGQYFRTVSKYALKASLSRRRIRRSAYLKEFYEGEKKSAVNSGLRSMSSMKSELQIRQKLKMRSTTRDASTKP